MEILCFMSMVITRESIHIFVTEEERAKTTFICMYQNCVAS